MFRSSPMTGRRPAAKAVVAAPTLAVGSQIEAVCSKCKKTTSHLVVRKIGVKPIRVTCGVCSGEHAFRSPLGTARTRERRAAAEEAARKDMTPEDLWKLTMSRARGTAVSYSTKLRFAVGQRLSHPTFGEGVVTSLPSGTVCEVTFVAGKTRLLMGS